MEVDIKKGAAILIHERENRIENVVRSLEKAVRNPKLTSIKRL